ncbi:uncharacterized protein LOC121007904 [Bufo bufo]|uniref:uncharacterized protein LOC121007904 n=1 Tax=Bufo bufo TaxID=8384 RepID=UPI001ABDE25D|nr:uncharacterized protein LOC121007904 [Bufo bufo]
MPFLFNFSANLLPLDKPVAWSEGFELSDRIVEAEPYVKASDFIIPVFVYSVQQLPTPQLKDELKEILHTATQLTTVVPIVVLTHRTHKNYPQVEAMFRDIGTEKFFPVENYTEKNPKRKKETDEEIIQFLYEVISDAEFRASYPRDADQEMSDRKVFVLKYIHDRELMIQRQNLDRQRYVEIKGAEQAFKLRKEEEEKERRKSGELFKEKLEKMRGEFQRQQLRDQYEHEKRKKELQKRKSK